MDNRPVLFIDSGIGGIPCTHFFYSRNKSEKIIYVADRANFPYGPQKKEILVDLLLSLVGKIVAKYNPKILVVACNTASVSALSVLRENFIDIPIVGTVPAIKPAVKASSRRRVGVIGTKRTIEDPYIAELASKYGPDCSIFKEAAAELVDFVEYRWLAANSGERLDAVKPWIEKFRLMGVDAVVLACTHFFLLLEEFQNAAGNDLQIFHSLGGVSRRVEFLLDEKGLRSSPEKNSDAPIVLVTGEQAPDGNWERLAEYFGFNLEAKH